MSIHSSFFFFKREKRKNKSQESCSSFDIYIPTNTQKLLLDFDSLIITLNKKYLFD